ncbi:MAG: hypothetical protein AUG50_01370 [Betaproteobacteria bacterium 13_1_20CM_3_63_8]|nr:MAG: hypothetical protein AUG50_01370 [Betaproteobacteria bacterium 13_1_20CM_3_63_8]
MRGDGAVVCAAAPALMASKRASIVSRIDLRDMITSYFGRNMHITGSRPIQLRHFLRWIFPRFNAVS